MDADRGDEIMHAVERLIRRHGRDGLSDAVTDTDVDWQSLWDRLHDTGLNSRLENQLATLHNRHERAYPSLVSVTFEPERFGFAPGEYLTVHYHHVPRPYSLASSPNRDDLEICIHRVPGGRLSHQLCDDLRVGEALAIRGPFGGNLTLREPSSRDVAFLATGTGVAPFKGMIDYLFEEGLDRHGRARRDVWLFLGASWRDDLPYAEAFRERAAEFDNFHFVPTLSRESLLSDWGGETAYVQRTFLKYVDDTSIDPSRLSGDERAALESDPKADVGARIRPDSLEVYACGLNAMVYQLRSTVNRVGVPEQYIRSEGYG
ncbi:ferredoxin--NADP reductase [Natronococcus wangiae]|uniref:ferredoxin--NADP reductase n=1 Tax=Natronococcus wangiae TaxID=3068275 RepID=UPI00273E23CD|nr:FAD-binding oxidoreductase [Natronococcus sp. AD5]